MSHLLVELPCIADERGKLVFLEAGHQIPFAIERVFILRDLSPGYERGSHAHRNCHQCLVALSGELTIHLDDGHHRSRQSLTKLTQAVYVPPMTWVVLSDFDAKTICMVLASDKYDPDDYIRDYDAFLSAVGRVGQ